jgi:hypothetical protein
MCSWEDEFMHWRVTTALAGMAVISLAACGRQKGSQAAAAAAPAPPKASITAGPLSLDQLPHQKPGLWRNTMTVEGLGRPIPAMEMCLDAATEARMAVWSRSVRNSRCAPSQFNRNLDGSISFKTACDLGPGGKRADSGTIVGDFNSGYKVTIDSTTAGAAVPAANGEHKMSIEATWVGPCSPGQKGGDVIMPGGRTINMGG